MPINSEAGIPAEHSETPFEAVSSICTILVIGLFALTFLMQNFKIPSGSMEKTLLIGDHLIVDRISLSPAAAWMPLLRYREPRHGDIIVFLKPGEDDTFLVKRLIALPGDHLHLQNGVVFLNGIPQNEPKARLWPEDTYVPYRDEFPSIPAAESDDPTTAEWAVELPNYIQGGDLVVPAGMYFMMGDHRHRSLDSRYWGFVPRANIVGRPLFNYWSFQTSGDEMYKTTFKDKLAWAEHILIHFFSGTRWRRTFLPVN